MPDASSTASAFMYLIKENKILWTADLVFFTMSSQALNKRGRLEGRGYAGVLCGVIGDNPASSPETGG